MAGRRSHRFGMEVPDFHSDRLTVAEAIEVQLRMAEENLLNARRMGGLASGIPTWAMLMHAWDEYLKRRTTLNHEPRTSGRTKPVVDRSTQTKPVSESWYEEATRWSTAADPWLLLFHPVLRVAINRDVVRVVSRRGVPQKKKAGGRSRSRATIKVQSEERLEEVQTKPAIKAAGHPIRLDGDVIRWPTMDLSELPDVELLSNDNAVLPRP